jgi:hypothetical protein
MPSIQSTDFSFCQEFHERRASQSVLSLAGETMSPTIRPVPAMDPIQCFFLGFGEGGTTSAPDRQIWLRGSADVCGGRAPGRRNTWP